jgi:DhnA family fructose-bisphosphate aldolase class Ia
MTNVGKKLRMKRVIDDVTGTSVICALDHGMTSPTFLSGLVDMERRLTETIAGGAHVIMMSPGMARRTADHFAKDVSLALLASASAAGAPTPRVVNVTAVHDAVRMGADAVVLYVALEPMHEPAMIGTLAEIGAECDRLGMPFIAEAEFPNAYQPAGEQQDEWGFDYLIRNSRLCAELGADIVKTNWSGNADSFARIVEAAGVPVVVAGGSQVTEAELLLRLEQAMAAGAIGCSVGRNIFQHDRPEAMTRAISRVVKERWPHTEALLELQSAVRAAAD